MEDIKLLKGNEVLALAAIRYGADAYFGYPITPQSEVLETLMEERPWETTGMVVVQAESEISSINMVYGGASCGKKVMTSSSSLGISLMCETISYLAAAELPCLLVNVMRGGPGLGTIQASQADYFQAVKGGGHGDYKLIVLAPNSVQEMNDFVGLGFDLAFKYNTPAMILTDGIIGQMMEKVQLSEQQPRWAEEFIRKQSPWALTGNPEGGAGVAGNRAYNKVTSVYLDSEELEERIENLYKKYDQIAQAEVRYEAINMDDAEYVLVAYGTASRICSKVVDDARAEGYKVGLIRPITLSPFPTEYIKEIANRKGMKGFLTVEMSKGQMVEDVRLAVNGATKVEFFGRTGGIVPSPTEVLTALKKMM